MVGCSVAGGRLREGVWRHPEEEETMQKWYVWSEKMKKEDEKRKMEEMHQQRQQRVSQMVKSAEGSRMWRISHGKMRS